MKLQDAIDLIGSTYGLQKTDSFDMRGPTGKAFDTIKNAIQILLQELQDVADWAENDGPEHLRNNALAAIKKAKGE